MAYTRSLSEKVSIPCYSINNLVTYTNQAKSGTFTGTRTGSAVPGWRLKLASGELAASPYYLDMSELKLLADPIRDLGYYISLNTSGPKTHIRNELHGYPGAPNASFYISHLSSPSASEAKSKALSRVYKALESERSEWNSSAFLAEFTSVLRQFGSPYRSAVKLFNNHLDRLTAVKRSFVAGSVQKKRERMSKIVGDIWLETSFGLLPLISDTESAAQAIARLGFEATDKPRLKDVVRTRASVIGRSQWVSTPYFGSGTFFRYKNVQNTETEARAQYVVGLKGDIRADFGSNQRLLELLGFESRNIPLALWEALPWSWLADYFGNIQSILQAGATITERVDWVVLTETKKTTVTHVSPLLSYNDLYHNYGTVSFSQSALINHRSKFPPGTFALIRTTMNRTIPTSLGIPDFYLKTPFEDLKKMGNLTALLFSRRKHDSNLWKF